MLMLVFYIGEERYAFPSDQVVEIVPKILLRKIPHAPPYVVGMLNFRGVPVPVVDLCLILQGRAAENRMHTRLVVLNCPMTDGQESVLVGILVERLTETAYHDAKDFVDAGIRARDLPFLGGVLTHDGEVTQLFLVDKLLEMVKDELFKSSA